MKSRENKSHVIFPAFESGAYSICGGVQGQEEAWGQPGSNDGLSDGGGWVELL